MADATRRRIDTLLEALYQAQQDQWPNEERDAFRQLRDIVNDNPVAADMAATKDRQSWQKENPP